MIEVQPTYDAVYKNIIMENKKSAYENQKIQFGDIHISIFL